MCGAGWIASGKRFADAGARLMCGRYPHEYYSSSCRSGGDRQGHPVRCGCAGRAAGHRPGGPALGVTAIVVAASTPPPDAVIVNLPGHRPVGMVTVALPRPALSVVV